MKNISYQERLNDLELQPLEVRCIEYDLMLLYKLVYGLVDMESDSLFSFNQNNTRAKKNN